MSSTLATTRSAAPRAKRVSVAAGVSETMCWGSAGISTAVPSSSVIVTGNVGAGGGGAGGAGGGGAARRGVVPGRGGGAAGGPGATGTANGCGQSEGVIGGACLSLEGRASTAGRRPDFRRWATVHRSGTVPESHRLRDVAGCSRRTPKAYHRRG